MEIKAIGGYGEIGKNMTAIRTGDDVILLDMGLMLDKYIQLTEEDTILKLSGKRLIACSAAPNVDILGNWKPLVKGIIIGHAHLDHVGAVPFLAPRFKCPVYGSPYTIAVLRSILRDEDIGIPNELKRVPIGTTFKLTKNVKIELINVTHSVPDSVMIAVHTPEGTVLYCNDFKLDPTPILGKTTDTKRLKSLKVKACILDTLYATKKDRVPSEQDAANLVEKTLEQERQSRFIIVTTFASQIARLKTIAQCCKSIGRKACFMGRSMAKYIEAAEKLNIAKFSDAEMVKFSSAVKKWLRKVKRPEQYVFIVTGHQGEPRSMLRKIVEEKMLPLDERDVVIFASSVIPTEINRLNREAIEQELTARKVRIIRDIHASGHGSILDQQELLRLVKPEHIIPSHSEQESMDAFIAMAKKEGYVEGKTVHRLYSGETLRL
ncbi:MAG: MBL fold metallo-hydrolase RNA specificity domain-containing protein [archaeon]